MKTTVIVPPDGEPVSLSAVKDYLRLGHDGEDTLVSALIGSARARLEAELDLALVTRTVKLEIGAWPKRFFKTGLALKPRTASALLEVAIVDAEGAREDLTTRFQLRDGRMCLRPWSFVPAIPAGGSAEITFEAGYGTADAVPDDLVLAVKMLAGQSYRLRDGGRTSDEAALPADIDDLLTPYRGVRL